MALRRRTLALTAAAFAMAAGGGGAIAATHGGSASKAPAAPGKGTTATPSTAQHHECPNMSGMSQTSGV
jgi:hypothetical protein